MTNRAFKTGESREQPSLLPPRIEDYVGPDNPVRAIESFVCALDLAKLGFRHADRGVEVGQPPYDPADLLKLYLYGYINQVRSSRRLEREACRNLELIWLLRNLKPGYRTIANFRKENWEALKAANRSFVLLVREAWPRWRHRCCDRRLVLPRRRQQGEHLYAQAARRTDRKAGPGDRGLRPVS
jgi:transposase